MANFNHERWYARHRREPRALAAARLRGRTPPATAAPRPSPGHRLIICGVVRGSRSVVEECYKWAVQREVFGERLIDKPVIRAKLAHMSAQVRRRGVNERLLHAGAWDIRTASPCRAPLSLAASSAGGALRPRAGHRSTRCTRGSSC